MNTATVNGPGAIPARSAPPKSHVEGTVVTMYTEDVSYRMRTVFAIIVVVAIGLGYVLRDQLPAAPHIVAPAALMLYAVLFWFYDAILWKLPGFRLLNSGIPNLAGDWEGTLRQDAGGAELPVKLTIRQTWSKLALILKTPEAYSRNTLVGLQVRDPNAVIMTWVYQFDMPHRPKSLTEHGRGIMEVTLHRAVAGPSMDGATLSGALFQCQPTETLRVDFKRPGPFYWNPKPL